MKKGTVAHRLKYKSFNPPLEIIKDCHIYEDKWHMEILSGLWPIPKSAASQLHCPPCLGFYFTDPYVSF